MREASRLFDDVLTLLRYHEIGNKVIWTKDRAIVVIFDKRQREKAYNIATEYLSRHCRSPGRSFTRSTPLYEIRQGGYEWSVGWNLDDDQFNACICAMIGNRPGFAINVV